jgi:protein-disulfide isomerase
MRIAFFTSALLLGFVVGTPAGAETVATIGDTEISREELETHVRPQLIELDNSRYEVLRGGVDQLIAQAVLQKEAAATGKTMEELINDNVIEKTEEPGEEEIAAIFEANKQQLGDTPIEAVRDRIVAMLRDRQEAELTRGYIGGLREKYDVTVRIDPPKVDVETGDLQVRGGKDAGVTIVGFSDYECPFCQRGEAVIAEVLADYGDKVRYFHRDYPLDFHANAIPAAIAARCANDQGKFWEYHDALFEGDALNDARYQELAAELELDREAFDSCRGDAATAAAIQADMAAGAAVGVSGTPAFFVNGRVLTGAQPLEAFKQIIDEEIAGSSN